jgi:hypothetical protein
VPSLLYGVPLSNAGVIQPYSIFLIDCVISKKVVERERQGTACPYACHAGPLPHGPRERRAPKDVIGNPSSCWGTSTARPLRCVRVIYCVSKERTACVFSVLSP